MTDLLPAAAAARPEQRAVRTGRVLPFARPGTLLPSDRQGISQFAARQHCARLQFTELDKGRMVALLEVATKRLCIERRGGVVVARKISGGMPFEDASLEGLLATVEVWLSAHSPARMPEEARSASAGVPGSESDAAPAQPSWAPAAPPATVVRPAVRPELRHAPDATLDVA